MSELVSIREVRIVLTALDSLWSKSGNVRRAAA